MDGGSDGGDAVTAYYIYGLEVQSEYFKSITNKTLVAA